MFKKLFGGKEVSKTKGGSRVYDYADTEKKSDIVAEQTPYIEEIEEHFNRIFPDSETTVFHEIISDLIHIDVHIVKTPEDIPFNVLYTTGMSAVPMILPDDIAQEYKHLERAELMMFIPEEWPVDENSFKDERHYWPVRLLKHLARFPHQYNTWLGYGHTIPNGTDYSAYADNTELSGVALSILSEEITFMTAKDGNQINFYSLIPLYKEEMDFKLQKGADALFDKMDEVFDDSWLVIDPQRKNICK